MGLDPGLRRLALGTLLAAFPGPVPPDWAVDLLADGLAGHTLFGTNVHDPAQVAASTAALRAGPAGRADRHRRGGRRRHPAGARHRQPVPGQRRPGRDRRRRRSPDGSTQSIGAELAALGITVNLAPTVDVNTADDNPVIGTRSFGADPARVAAPLGRRRGRAAGRRRGRLRQALPRARRHASPTPTTSCPPWTLRWTCSAQRDLPPFAAVVAAGAQRRHDRAHPGAGADRRPTRPPSAGPSWSTCCAASTASPAP